MRMRWLPVLLLVFLPACSSNQQAAEPQPGSAQINNKDPNAASAPGIGPTGPGARMSGAPMPPGKTNPLANKGAAGKQ